jgi:mannose-6-phosphate isomerase-like protein (cupin superfamily)
MSFKIRRVVTGLNAAGKSTVIFDGEAPNSIGLGDAWPGLHVTTLWTTDQSPVDNRGDADLSLQPAGHDPTANGTIFRFYEFPPDSVRPPMPSKMLGLSGWTEDDLKINDMMHATNSIDYLVVLSGEMTMVMEDRTEVVLKRGDCLVQRGTKHGWSNRGKEPVLLFVALVGAKPLAK